MNENQYKVTRNAIAAFEKAEIMAMVHVNGIRSQLHDLRHEVVTFEKDYPGVVNNVTERLAAIDSKVVSIDHEILALVGLRESFAQESRRLAMSESDGEELIVQAGKIIEDNYFGDGLEVDYSFGGTYIVGARMKTVSELLEITSEGDPGEGDYSHISQSILSSTLEKTLLDPSFGYNEVD